MVEMLTRERSPRTRGQGGGGQITLTAAMDPDMVEMLTRETSPRTRGQGGGGRITLGRQTTLGVPMHVVVVQMLRRQGMVVGVKGLWIDFLSRVPNRKLLNQMFPTPSAAPIYILGPPIQILTPNNSLPLSPFLESFAHSGQHTTTPGLPPNVIVRVSVARPVHFPAATVADPSASNKYTNGLLLLHISMA